MKHSHPKHWYSHPKHGHTSQDGKTQRTPTYRAWQNMMARCFQPSNPAFRHYKKRGITVCERWRSFQSFLADMGEKPGGKREFTLERIDNSKGYFPSNCRWATWREQGNNRITNIHYIYRGMRYTLSELARVTNVPKGLLRERLTRGKGGPWTTEVAVTTPKRKGYRTDLLGPMAK